MSPKPLPCLVFTAVLALGAGGSPAQDVAARPRLVEPDEHKLLMLDSRVMASVTGARLVPGQVVKEARNPLFQADKPWENSLNNLYPNVLWDEEEQVFKLWYKCVLADPEAIAKMDGPSTVHDVGWYLLYANSRDGLSWEKPALGLHAYGGDRNTNIVARDTPNVGVFKDAREPDPSRRYKMVYDVGLGKLRARFSADGIHWGEPVEMQGFSSKNGDTHNNAFWDAKSGKYLWFTKLYLGERLVARAESDDFLHWKNNGLVLRSGTAEGRDSQTYCLPVFRYGSVYLGYVMMYRLGHGRMVECELAWSPDGLEWRRVFPGTPFIPRGAEGSFDSQCIYAMAGPPIAQGGDLLIYYGGDDFPHTGWKRHCLLALARLPLDHFAGYRPESPDGKARLVTRELRSHPSGLKVTATVEPGGSVQIVALDATGRELGAARPIRAGGHDLPVTWEAGKESVAPGGTVSYRIELDRATLYALAGVSLVSTDLPVEPSPLAEAVWKPRPVAERRVTFDEGADGWTGVETLVHRPGVGQESGHVTVNRPEGQSPIARSPSAAEGSPLAGDWPEMLGGRGVEIACRVRLSRPGSRVQIEIFAGEAAQWAYEVPEVVGEGWQTVVAPLRYGWTDEEARAAGWRPSVSGFSWAETIRGVGRVVVLPVSTAAGSFDLDAVTLRGVAE
ncbi:MAG: hypothetical protein JNK37_14405 [Verrucomicrobiales bacterium]|nr:hypothetical protein [Verrucomicrobiales bacterium]